MAKRRCDEVSVAVAEIPSVLSQVPSVDYLERRLQELRDEAAKVEALLVCVRGMRGGFELVEDESLVASAAGQV